jgi:hypothetical protein
MIAIGILSIASIVIIGTAVVAASATKNRGIPELALLISLKTRWSRPKQQ